ncbi:MAG: hypothetical protein COB77_06385 [Gammaproteobacteria bacterium]|nr:MAG: hypothetical protein COB77_06385 [Gammaproteobacteria bacterium]
MPSKLDHPQQTHHKTLNRRRILQMGVAAATTLMLPNSYGKTLSNAIEMPDRKLSLINLHTGESIKTTYWAEGQYQANELIAINRILRDHRTNDVHPIDTKLLDLLNTLQQTMNSEQTFQVISGFRSAKTNATLSKNSNGVAKKSLHMQGKAIDIRLPGCQLSDLRKAAIHCQAGGVGYYPRSNFIHIDTGNVRRWG